VLTGYNRLDQLRASEPDLIVEHLGELREILERNGLNLRPQHASGPVGLNGHPVVTVGALIFNNAGQALMIRTQKWSHLWGIPAARSNGAKARWTLFDARSKRRPTWTFDDIRLVLTQDCIHSKEFYRDAHLWLLNYTCRCVGEPRVKLNEEAQEFRWVSVAEALAMELNQPTRILIEAVKQTGG